MFGIKVLIVAGMDGHCLLTLHPILSSRRSHFGQKLLVFYKRQSNWWCVLLMWSTSSLRHLSKLSQLGFIFFSLLVTLPYWSHTGFATEWVYYVIIEKNLMLHIVSLPQFNFGQMHDCTVTNSWKTLVSNLHSSLNYPRPQFL